MYTPQQEAFLEAITKKVQNFFEEHPLKGHEFDHAYRVQENIKEIAQRENKKDVWLYEVSALLHDIGRVTEHYTLNNTTRHHELSYELLKVWFNEDRVFDFLTLEQKKELLYGVRYHWNDAADEYESAIFLRDADKIDLLGNIGIERTCAFLNNDEHAINEDVVKKYYCYYWIRTEAAKNIVKENSLIEQVDDFFIPRLRSYVKGVEL